MTSATLAELPPEVRKEAAAVPIFFEASPSQEDIQSGIDPDLLGLFDPGDAATPRIRLWLGNLWDFADHHTPTFREEVRITLLHEIGHLLGWDEEDLETRGLG